jgi:hypothetical protein
MSSWVDILGLLTEGLAVDLVLVGRATNETQWTTTVRSRVILIAVKGPDSFGHMMTGVGYRELAGVPASSSKTAAKVAGRPG